MRTSDFYFELPDELIAQQPCETRSASRLLHLSRTAGSTACALNHRQFSDLPNLLNKNDLLVFNDTRVIPARLYGQKATGGKVEILIERLLDDTHCLAQVRASKTPKSGSMIHLIAKQEEQHDNPHDDPHDNQTNNSEPDFTLKVEGRQDEFFVLSSTNETQLSYIMEQVGHMPLPPYINRDDNNFDQERYQTVYSKNPGAVAAPTAGLHFDEATLQQLTEKGVQFGYVTLHVGAGTFQPVRTEDIEDHNIHTEYLEVSQALVEQCEQARDQGGRIIAVGTTAVRSLETASREGRLQPYQGDTAIFIYPGYVFKSIDAMITNFHLPESTLIMLVSAFASRQCILDAYQKAINENYRFFSYGDAMLIE